MNNTPKIQILGSFGGGDAATPVQSVNGKTGDVELDASDVGARPNTWMPSYSDVNADKAGTAQSLVSSHNTNDAAHNDIRLELQRLAGIIADLLDSDDTTLDEMHEVVAYIKSNKTLIDAITTSKVNVTDIINDLVTNVSNKPLSAAQGVALKALINALETNKLDASAVTEAINTALAQAKASGEFDGKDGIDGKDGYTPVKGTDYYTPEEQAEWEAFIAAELAKRGQLKPEFAQTVDECTDTTKSYVLPDGMIWAYMYTEVEIGGYTPVVDPTSEDFKAGSRYNASGAITTSSIEKDNCFVSNMFLIKSGDILRIRGVRASTSEVAYAPVFVAARLTADGSNAISAGSANNIYLGQPLGASVATGQQAWNAFETLDDGTIVWTYAINNNGGNMAENDGTFLGEIAYTRIAGVATDGIENVIVTVNEEIIETTLEKRYGWTNTGHAFVPADYEDRIIALEAEDVKIREEIASAKTETDTAIANLQEQIDSGAASAKSGARWFALGDSITEGWASAVDASASNGYKQFLNTNAAQRWVNIVAEKNGYELTNYGIGGTGYLRNTDTKYNARQLVDTLDFTQCDFVTLAYGVNDWKYAVNIGSMDDDIETGGSMVANMRYVIQKILTDNPYCKIFVITPINCRSYGSYDTNWGINYKGGTTGALNGLGLQDIFDRMKEVCDYHGVELIDMTHSSIINRENIKTMLADYVHPTVECHAVMARELARKINFV